MGHKLSLAEAQALYSGGNLKGAAEACRAILRDTPGDAGALHLLGVTLSKGGQHASALAWLERAITAGGADAALLYDYGMVLRALGRMGEAVRAFRLATQGNSRDADAWFALGTARFTLGQYAEAAAALRTAAELSPARADIRNNLGLALVALGETDAAADAFTLAVGLDPDYIEPRLQLGMIQQRRGAFDLARATFHEAVQRAPDDAKAYAHLGNVLRDTGRFMEAQAAFEHARARAPDDPEVIANQGLAWQHAGELDEAIECYRRAIELAPGNEPLRFNLAQALLLAGRFEEGWAEFEHRLSDPVISAQIAGLPGRRWHGEDVAGRRLILRCEQGLGDAIQFARYVPLLAGKGARVILVGPARLARLARGIDGLADYCAEDLPLPAADLHAPLLSLPHLLAGEPIPTAVPYLAPEPELVARWNRRLADDGRRRIGIAWQGNPAYEMDYLRSVPAARMAEMIDGIDARFIVLQRGGVSAQALHDMGAEDLGMDFDREDAFVDSAAVMANLDLVITSDTALAHLAGALGRPTWVLLPYAPDWRWRRERTDCDWYPGMQLFRQPVPGDWPGAVAKVRAMLTAGA